MLRGAVWWLKILGYTDQEERVQKPARQQGRDPAPYFALADARASAKYSAMASEIKPIVSMEHTFDLLDIRVGRLLSVERAENAAKISYVLTADFGRFGIKTSVARLTQHSVEGLTGKQILGVLNFDPREIGGIVSEFLCLGVQLPKADSGEATIVAPLKEVKLGSKLF